ncbi:nicotinate-nucleotide adenylyltransferase [Candidatus Kinetoplastibacterium oncopeltii TCC290E]|uniref:Probable nicotinate-nucleotide adenylyltransferase n=1 Tax=Candidatus Kinetoplastidibacterium stringomonadis TCC290E TaxID=1208920 RepID=M1M876_9PROT|nr:nicotinate (nicotinamide) nucleotide adenylyltransferase [Candidatus Kinetoplastibacterium oncopeltii]AGF48210.1 nicotinate-nucleotide adenylyltransferase [Candidatus Kinetoplastibacterium oncopeltii TCC290E]
MKKKIGVFGGSFDPIHISHINLAMIALDSLKLDEVHLIPVFSQCHKYKLQATPIDRLNMLKLATINYPLLKINDIEIKNCKVSYTIDTIKILQKKYECTLILGSDQINNFCTWKNWIEIIENANIAVAQRSNIPIDLSNELISSMYSLHKCISIIPLNQTDISSSTIRRYILNQNNDSVDDMLDPFVREYIKINNLYK